MDVFGKASLLSLYQSEEGTGKFSYKKKKKTVGGCYSGAESDFQNMKIKLT